MTPETYWLFNTDETEPVGEGTYQAMLDQSRFAAWGNCHGQGANKTLQLPKVGDVVFFFCAGQGIIASGAAIDDKPFRSNSIFGKRHDGEYHRVVKNLRVLSEPLTVAKIEAETSYHLPYRHIVCRVKNRRAAKFIAKYIEKESGIIVDDKDLSDEQIDEAIKRNKLRFRDDTEISASDVVVIARRRRGQDRLRLLALEAYCYQCALCDVDDEALLEACHVVRWSDDAATRADLRNIICFCKFHHALFDAGYLALTDKLEVVRKNGCEGKMLCGVLGLTSAFRIGNERYCPNPAYLKRHRKRFGTETIKG